MISHAKGKFLTEHLILSLFPDFALSRTPKIPRQKHTLEHLPVAASISQLFLREGKTETIYHTSSVI